MKALALIAALAIAGCAPIGRVLDGDTVVINGERIRLNGIDAPEMPGHCRRGRDCAPGDAYDSRDSLTEILAGSPVRIERLKRDRYGRTVANLWVGSLNVSCEQLRRGQAIYKPRWDEGRTLAKECGL